MSNHLYIVTISAKLISYLNLHRAVAVFDKKWHSYILGSAGICQADHKQGEVAISPSNRCRHGMEGKTRQIISRYTFFNWYIYISLSIIFQHTSVLCMPILHAYPVNLDPHAVGFLLCIFVGLPQPQWMFSKFILCMNS